MPKVPPPLLKSSGINHAENHEARNALFSVPHRRGRQRLVAFPVTWTGETLN